jgi:hypothetical protein
MHSRVPSICNQTHLPKNLWCSTPESAQQWSAKLSNGETKVGVRVGAGVLAPCGPAPFYYADKLVGFVPIDNVEGNPSYRRC